MLRVLCPVEARGQLDGRHAASEQTLPYLRSVFSPLSLSTSAASSPESFPCNWARRRPGRCRSVSRELLLLLLCLLCATQRQFHGSGNVSTRELQPPGAVLGAKPHRD
jgi:hypothetical protein